MHRRVVLSLGSFRRGLSTSLRVGAPASTKPVVRPSTVGSEGSGRTDGTSRWRASRTPLPPLDAYGREMNRADLEAAHDVLGTIEHDLQPTPAHHRPAASPSPPPSAPAPEPAPAPSPKRSSRKPAPASAQPLSLEEQVRANILKYPDTLLLTQVGNFYESYFTQAPLVAKLTAIKLTTKVFKGVRHPFCGFPLAALPKHLSTLVEKGYRVVVVDELGDDGPADDLDLDVDVGLPAPTKKARELKKRVVTRIVTPGTGVDEGFINTESNNFILAIGFPDAPISSPPDPIPLTLAYRDVATGDAFLRHSSSKTLRDDLLLIAPVEVIAPTPFPPALVDLLRAEESREPFLLSFLASADSVDPPRSQNPAAEDVLKEYLSETLLSTPPPDVMPTEVDPSQVLQMDSVTLQSLEVRASLRGGTKGSLLATVKKTVTPGGGRLLVERLCAPSTNLTEINSRLTLVNLLIRTPPLLGYLRAALSTLDDTSRHLQRLSMRRPGAASALLSLKRSIRIMEDIKIYLLNDWGSLNEEERTVLQHLKARMGEHAELADGIEKAIDEQSLLALERRNERLKLLAEDLGEGGAEKELEDKDEGEVGVWDRNEPWVVRHDFSPELAELHEERTAIATQAERLEQACRTKYGAPSLKLKTAPKLGAVVWVKNSESRIIKENEGKAVTLLNKSGSTRWYAMSQWTAVHTALAKVDRKIRRFESKAIGDLVYVTLESYLALSDMSRVLDELDVAQGFAHVAAEGSTSTSIINGRHPTVEMALMAEGRMFTANSIAFSHPDAFLHCLTGPNMAGKSTYLRQNALIILLAQTGSYVPATSANIGIVDRIFSRVGARDELDRGRSTFMIEMDEAASILEAATDKSLVLLDELGRGTSPLDGLAIAYAAIEHLVHINRSRTLFATHYHRLGELLGYDKRNPEKKAESEWKGVEFWCTDVEESDDNGVRYSHVLRRGLNDDSAGLLIAKLAGIPERAIKVAEKIRQSYSVP
ncbi:DNA mismatch repair protein MutS [Pseudohyphozyma bogoriensis]|nr:DNA mismatch repair protein MutS [Pseudohyphozyma bogoriensis]